MTADLRAALGAQRLAGEVKRHRHAWGFVTRAIDTVAVPPVMEGWWECRSCGAVKDEARSRRGKSARRMGNDFERELVHLFSAAFPDARRTGMFGGPDDVIAGPLYVQAKKQAGLYPRGAETLLKAAEAHCTADQYPVVAYAHPDHAPHHKLVVMDLLDFVNLLRGGER